MKLLLKSVTIIDTQSKYHGKTVDVLIENGKISEISKQITDDKAKIVDAKGCSLSPSWIDMNTCIYEPGFEYREDFESGLNAAACAGYGAVCIMPNTFPVVDNKTQVEFVKNAGIGKLTNTYALGAVSQETKGIDLAEIYDMHTSGAVAFCDGNKAIQSAGLMERALLYVKKFNGLVYSFPYNESISGHGQMNESIVSTRLGLHASPKLAEEIMVARDLYLLEYTQSRLHFVQVSTKKSVELIKKAKKDGLNVTAGVNVANLYFDDEKLLDYDTNFKVKPHLRNKEDVKALLQGLKDGTIDVINSGHNPLHEDEKKVEFENAKFGASTIDCSFTAAQKATEKYLTEQELIDKFTNGYKILNIEKPTIKKDSEAHFTLYNWNKTTKFTKEKVLSKGKNNPFVGEEFNSTVLGVINKNKTNIL